MRFPAHKRVHMIAKVDKVAFKRPWQNFFQKTRALTVTFPRPAIMNRLTIYDERNDFPNTSVGDCVKVEIALASDYEQWGLGKRAVDVESAVPA
jgi:hypothetical protein